MWQVYVFLCGTFWIFPNIFDPWLVESVDTGANCTLLDSDVIQDNSYLYSEATGCIRFCQ